MLNYEIKTYIFQDENGDRYWVSEYPSLKGAIGAGETPVESIHDLETNAQILLEFMEEKGLPIPKCDAVQKEEQFSGKISLRVGIKTHKMIIDSAKSENLSMNAWINGAILYKLGQNESIKFLNKNMLKLTEAVERFSSANLELSKVYREEIKTNENTHLTNRYISGDNKYVHRLKFN